MRGKRTGNRKGEPLGITSEKSPHCRWGGQTERTSGGQGQPRGLVRPGQTGPGRAFGRTGPALRVPSAFRTQPSAWRSENLWDGRLMWPCPRLRRLETNESDGDKGGAALQRQTTNTFAFVFPPRRATRQVWGTGSAGAAAVRPSPPRGAGPGRMRGPGRRRPRPPAQPRSGRSPWQRARGGRGRARRPRRLLFLPLPVPCGHVAMATVLLTAAASRLGWRA